MSPPPISSLHFTSVEAPAHIAPPTRDGAGEIERAAGTGLTGHSDQEFVPMSLGPLEADATLVQLRIVIGTESAIVDEPARPLVERQTPARPAARP
jgi:tetrahydromethanopterin S-methyltransferase subunit D